ncbi:UNVERIFIED_CONTAM: hypothetical protein K2H54_029114 [Gekko kuhli]
MGAAAATAIAEPTSPVPAACEADAIRMSCKPQLRRSFSEQLHGTKKKEADSLKCHKCLNRQGNCSDTEVEVCMPGQDSCFFEIKWFIGLDADTAKQGCGTSNYCRRYPGGYRGFLFRRMHCCSTDLCLPVDYHAEKGPKTVQNVRAVSGVQPNVARMLPQSCASGNRTDVCKYHSVSCQVLQKWVSSIERMRAVRTWLWGCKEMSIITNDITGEGLEPIIKGCGTNSIKDAQVVYQIGTNWAYVDQKVCKGSNCNNGTFQDISAGDPNGLRCYTCRETGLGQCARNKLQLLNCTGVMDRCVHFMDKDLISCEAGSQDSVASGAKLFLAGLSLF